jgi:hypothetical protein
MKRGGGLLSLIAEEALANLRRINAEEATHCTLDFSQIFSL